MYNDFEFKSGDNKIVQLTVSPEDTALNYGSGKLENLFATPKLVALMIEASVKLIDDKLTEDFISVGKIVHVEHIAPTTQGQLVTLEVKITNYNPPMIELSMTAYDEIGLIGKGFHTRYIVNKRLLLTKAYDRAEKIGLE